MPMVAIATIWWTVGFNVLLFLAALKNIPQDLYEAARLDGALGSGDLPVTSPGASCAP